jgi:HEAT repeat protein
VVPELTEVLSDEDQSLVEEALRSLFTIGTPAVGAAPNVARFIESNRASTRQLATLVIGQIAHKVPSLCVGPVTSALMHDECRHPALRILAFLGDAAKSSLSAVASLYESPDAKTRSLAAIAAISIDLESEAAQQIIAQARTDPSKAVRSAVNQAAHKVQEDSPKQRRLDALEDNPNHCSGVL